MECALPTLIVGLGNPGPEYEGTRHNVGFIVLDRICSKAGPPTVTERRWDCELVRLRIGGGSRTLAKPLTFMNRSGGAVAKLTRKLGVAPEQVFVVYDCLDLPLGCLRIRGAGGSGGHRGMESVLGSLGTQDVPRLRIGIGRAADSDVVRHVLTPWDDDEQDVAEQVVDAAAEAVIVACRAGVERAMNLYNRWNVEAK